MKRWLYVALFPTLLVLPAAVHAQEEGGQFAWFGELVAFDDGAKTLTAKSPIQEHVARYVERFQPGDRVVLFWSQYEAEGDVIR